MTRARRSAKGAGLPDQPDAAPLPTLHARFADDLHAALDLLEHDGALPAGLSRAGVTTEPPRDPAHGDIATNAAMVLAKGAGTNPRALAALLQAKLAGLPYVAGGEVAGPGFLNLRLADAAWAGELGLIGREGVGYGRSAAGRGRRVNVEYVSANPTGPMHMGHCRGAVVGDALAGVLEWAGHAVTREYYVNDAGAQVQVLARSAYLRYVEAAEGTPVAIPEGLYPGDYLKAVGEALFERHGRTFLEQPESAWLPPVREFTVAAMMDTIRHDLALLGIEHEVFASEAAVQREGRVDAAFARLEADGLIYRGQLEPPKGELPDDWEPAEMTLFRATAFGDDGDRPVRKADGGLTYFGTDLAYHLQKAEGADELIDIWGADHAGTVKRIRAAVAALTGNKPFDVKLVQMVRLLRGGEPVKMSKRSGSFVTLAEVVEEVGRDAVRFTMLTRRADAQMDFDFARVKEASKDNPVFYVQYAHARIASLGRKAADAGVSAAAADLSRLDADELSLVKLAAQFPRVIEAAAAAREPHRVAFYLYDLAAAFHAQWNKGNDDPARRFLVADRPDLSAARLALAQGVGQVVRNGLAVLGVAAAEEM